jgi:hypothetical protein
VFDSYITSSNSYRAALLAGVVERDLDWQRTLGCPKSEIQVSNRKPENSVNRDSVVGITTGYRLDNSGVGV